jgi:hypothetical protein
MAIRTPFSPEIAQKLTDARFIPPEIMKVLEFYASPENWRQCGWYGEPEDSNVEVDGGKRARALLNHLRVAAR